MNGKTEDTDSDPSQKVRVMTKKLRPKRGGEKDRAESTGFEQTGD